MTFVNISLLAGAALIAVPIILHLIMRRKPTLLVFPALRFIQKRHDVNSRRLQLRHLLLLLLRAAVIALLAFALARPSVKLGVAGGSQEAPVAAALVFDAAPRMEYRHENKTRLEAAKELGHWLLAQLPEQSEVAVLDNHLAGTAAFQPDRGAAKDRITRLESISNSQPLPVVIESAIKLLRQSPLDRKEIYIFTDLSRGAWPSEQSLRMQQQLTELGDVALYLIDVGIREPVNFGLAELNLSGEVLSSRSPLRINTAISAVGKRETRVVELYAIGPDSQPLKRSQETVEVLPGEARPLELRLGGLEEGTHQGYLRIAGQDGLAADDVRYFTVVVKPAWRVLIAAPKPADRYAVFLAEALAPSVYRKRGQARFDCEISTLEELAQRPLAEYAAVFVLDPTPLQPALWKRLTDYTAEGHGLAIALGRNASPIDSFNEPQAQQLLPGKLLRQARRTDGSLHLAPRDFQHPVLASFRQYAGAIPWDAFPVFRYWELDDLHKGVGMVLPYNDGRPALLERSVGQGRVLLMTTPISDRPNNSPWNLLPVGEAWPFLILVNEMAAHLVGSSDQQFNYLAGQTAVLQLNPGKQHRGYLLTTPDGQQTPYTSDLNRRELPITTTDRVGNYQVKAGGVGGVNMGFSVNFAADQTRLDRLDEKELKEVFGPTKFHLAQTREQIERSVSTARVGRELFPPLILLLAAALGLELLMANRFYRE